jgi:NAD(P)-dependent dehydrogenase (short-subunit alcohol dehydrogenase family)
MTSPDRHPANSRSPATLCYGGLAGRTALVTGAAGGIGRAIVSAMAGAGVRVLATDLGGASLESLMDSVQDRSMVTPLAADLSLEAEPKRLVEYALELHGHLDILVNNAGCIVRHDVAEASIHEWELMFAVNLRAAFFLAQHASRSMSAHGWGRIINVTSQAGHTGGAADCPIYAITKGGLITMTRALARSLAPRGVTVNAVAPGIVMTEMISGTLSDAQISSLIGQIPVRKPSEPAEIASAILYLASTDAATITGHVLDINGGMVMR